MKKLRKYISKISLFTLLTVSISMLPQNIHAEESEEIKAIKNEISELEIKKKLLENKLMNIDNEPVEEEDDPACSSLKIIELQGDIDLLEENISKKEAEIAGINAEIKNMEDSIKKLNKNIKGQKDAQIATGIIGGITTIGAIGLGVASHLKKNEIEETCSVKAAEQIFENWKLAYGRQECDRVYRGGYGYTTITNNIFDSCNCCKGGENDCRNKARSLIDDYMRSPECTGNQPPQNASAWNGNTNTNQNFVVVECQKLIDNSNNLEHGLITMVNDEKNRNSNVNITFTDNEECRDTFKNEYGNHAYNRIVKQTSSNGLIDVNSINSALNRECPILCSSNSTSVMEEIKTKCLNDCMSNQVNIEGLAQKINFSNDSAEINSPQIINSIAEELIKHQNSGYTMTVYIKGYSDSSCGIRLANGQKDIEKCKRYNGNLSMMRAESVMSALSKYQSPNTSYAERTINPNKIKIMGIERISNCSPTNWKSCFNNDPGSSDTWKSAPYACGIYGEGSTSKDSLAGKGAKRITISTASYDEGCKPQKP